MSPKIVRYLYAASVGNKDFFPQTIIGGLGSSKMSVYTWKLVIDK